MSNDWSGGYGNGRPANAKIPVKVHRNVSLVRTSEAVLAEELLARPRLSRLIVGRLAPDVMLIRANGVREAIEEIRKLGHTPQVIGGK